MSVGRPNKPTFLKLVTGTQRKSRANPSEPKPAASAPRLPEHLAGQARLAWLRFAPLLAGMGVLTTADGSALERMCECYAEIRTLTDTIARDGGPTIRPALRKADGTAAIDAEGMAILGRPIAHPAVALRADADRRYKAYLTEFGLTPAARAKVKVTDPGTGKPAGAEWLD